MNEHEFVTNLRRVLEQSYGDETKVELEVRLDPARCTPGMRSLLARGVVIWFVEGKGPGLLEWRREPETAEVEL